MQPEKPLRSRGGEGVAKQTARLIPHAERILNPQPINDLPMIQVFGVQHFCPAEECTSVSGNRTKSAQDRLSHSGFLDTHDMLFPTKKARLLPGFFIKSFVFKYAACKPFAFKYGGMKAYRGRG
jgi:hypothetical protein